MHTKTILAIAAFSSLGAGAQAQDRSSEKDILTIYKGPHTYKEVSVAGKTTEIYVDDRQVAGNELPYYDSLIQVMRTDVNQANGDLSSFDEPDARDEEQGQRDREQSQRDREQGQRDREQDQRDREQEQRDREQGQRDREQGQRDRDQAAQDRARMRAIVQYLVDKKIIPDQAHLSGLVLTDIALYVNGVRQPNEIHQALKEKYAGWAHDGITYGNACASGVNVHIDLRGDCCQ